MLNEGQIILYTAKPVKSLAAGNKNVSAAKQLTLHNTLANTSRNIYFYDTGIIDTQLAFQPTVVSDVQIQYDWKINASQNFVQRVNAQHFENWVHTVNKRIHIPHNKTMQLVILDDGIEVRSRFEKGAQSYSRFGTDFQTALSGDATISKVTDECDITISPLDVVALFASLTSLNITSNVIIEGNEHIMRIAYETDTAKYETFIPACSIKGKRDATYFVEYEANE